MPLVSVVIPAHNRPGMLREAVESVLAQTHQTLEVIIVLNGETKEVSASAAELRRSDPRVTVTTTGSDNTLAFARNTGIAAARGEWIAFLDDDDLWLPRKIEKQLEAANTHGADFIATNLVAFNATGDLPGAFIPKRPAGLSFGEAQTIYNYIPAGSSTMMARRSALREVGAFDGSLYAVEDWDMWRRMSWKHKFHLVDEVLAKYRRHNSNMSRRRFFMIRQETRHVWKLTFDTPKHLRHMIPRAWKGIIYRYFANVYEVLNEQTGNRPRQLIRLLRNTSC